MLLVLIKINKRHKTKQINLLYNLHSNKLKLKRLLYLVTFKIINQVEIIINKAVSIIRLIKHNKIKRLRNLYKKEIGKSIINLYL
jgi:hypothetical protein